MDALLYATLQILCLIYVTVGSHAATDKEVNALLEMRHSFIDLEGSLDDWMSANASRVCEWTGITCNTNGNIQKIGLTQLGLTGIVTPQISDLEFLEELLLNQNDLKGNLPNVMGLSKLRKMRLEANSFSGGFYFRDAHNWQSPLGRVLEELWVDENELHGTVESAPPEVFSQSPIKVLRYGKQNFYGTIPSGYQGFPQLQDLRIGYNEFMGTIPSLWESMRLRILYVPAMPGMCGPLPAFSSEPSITDLGSSFGTDCPEPPSYYQNEVDTLLDLKATLKDTSGELSSWTNTTQSDLCTDWVGITCDSMNHVKAVKLDSLNLEGNVNKDIKNLLYLRKLSLMNNKLSGPLPDLTKLRVKELKLTGNRLNGSIMVDDQAFWETDLAASLHHLWLDDNEFSGRFAGGEASMFWRTPLVNLRLNGNNLDGSLPQGLEGFLRLTTLTLGSNNFTGTVPTAWISAHNLTMLDLSNLLVCGELPSFPNTTLVDTHGTQINKSCFTESPALTNEETLAIRSSLGLYLDQAHTIVQHMQGTSSSQQDEILLKIVVTLATGLASFAFFLALGWGIYRISAAPKLLNADLSNTAGSW